MCASPSKTPRASEICSTESAFHDPKGYSRICWAAPRLPTTSLGRQEELMMRRSVFSLLFVVVFVASCAVITTAENAAQTLDRPYELSQGDNTARNLKSTDDSIPADKEERAGVTSFATRIKALFRKSPSKMSEAKNNAKGANEAISKVNSIIGKGKTSTELTPAKMKEFETYAQSNPDKWYAMAYYINYVFGIGLVVFLLYGTFYLGWRPLGVGGPRNN